MIDVAERFPDNRHHRASNKVKTPLRVSVKRELRIRAEITAFRIAHHVSLQEQRLSKAPAGENSDWQGDNH